MNLRTSRIRSVVAVLAAPLLLASVARAQNPHAGTWDSTELTIKEPVAGCRYVETVTAVFHLAAGINNTVSGVLTRRLTRSWWLANPGCVMPGAKSSAEFVLRQDTWTAIGERQGPEVQRLKGVYAGCGTDCQEPWSPPGSFEIELTRRSNGLTGGPLKDIVGPTLFRDSYQSQVDAARASEAFMALLQPLLDGRCEEFLLRSVDASSHRRFPRDPICAFSSQVMKLLPTVIRTDASQALSVSLGQIVGMGGPMILTEGDVLVQRFVVTNSSGNGLHLGGVLRKQPDNSWKVLDLVQ